MADNNWLEDLEKDLKGVLKKGNTPVKNNNEVKMDKKNNGNQLLLFGVVLMLAVGIFVSLRLKTNNAVQSNWQAQAQLQPSQTQQGSPWVTPGPQQVNPNMWQNPASQPLEQKVDLLKKQYENIDLAAQKIWERTKWNSDRITLLATVNNHNLVVQQQNYPKSELIFLNPDWTINRLPNRIALDAADQEFLRRFLRQAQQQQQTTTQQQ